MDDDIRKKLEAAKSESERKEQEEEAREKAARDEKAAQIAKMGARKTELKGKILAEIDEFEKPMPKYLETPFPYESFCKVTEKNNVRFSPD